MGIKRNKINGFDLLYIIVGLPWLFLMVITSRGFTSIKMSLLIILGIIAIFELIGNKKGIPLNWFILTLIMIVYFTISLFIGLLNGYKFNLGEDNALIQFYFITPILAVVLSTIFYQHEDRIRVLLEALKWFTLITVILDVDKILWYKGIFPNLDFLDLVMIASDVVESNELAVRVSNEAGLIFLLPIYIFLLINGKNKKYNKFQYSLIAIFGILYALISGRKMLEILIAFSICVSIITLIERDFVKGIPIKRMIARFLVVIAIIILLYYGLNIFAKALGVDSVIAGAWKTIRYGLSSNARGVISRSGNIKALFNMWTSSPIIGHGLNSYAKDSIANTVTYWSYEVFYNAFLAQTGLIGISILFIAIIGILFALYKKFRSTGNDIYLAFAIGFLCFAIGGASNPMLYYIWPWAICLALMYPKNRDVSIN